MHRHQREARMRVGLALWLERKLQVDANEALVAKVSETWGCKLCFCPDGQPWHLALEHLVNTSVDTLRALSRGWRHCQTWMGQFLMTMMMIHVLSPGGQHVGETWKL